MLNKMLISACLTLCLAACAASPSAPQATQAAAAVESPPAGCVSESATRIPTSPRDCGAYGHQWSQQDIKSTGATSAGQALRLLDPTVTVH
jgi:hypothetical protein